MQLDRAEDSADITRLVFEAPKRRREGKSAMAETIVMAKFQLKYLEQTFTADKATVRHDFCLSVAFADKASGSTPDVGRSRNGI